MELGVPHEHYIQQSYSCSCLLPVSLMSGVFPPSAESAGDGGEADLGTREATAAAEAEADEPVEEAEASRLLCARHAV